MTREVLLEAVAREVTVGHVGPMADEYLEDGIPFLRSLNIRPHRISREEIRHISPEFHGRLKKSALKPGDVVIVRTGKPGTCAVIPDDLPVANCSDLVIVRCGPEIRPRFLAYWVNAIASEHVASHLVGAVQQHFNVGAAKKMPIVLPDITEQDKVLSILGALDDKIELNRRMSATLEKMARALYRSWFVDFDPVQARTLGQPPAHMDATTAALFPDSFGPDGLPKGWERRPFSDQVTIISGGTPKTSVPEYWGGEIPWYSVVDAPEAGAVFVLDTEKKITDAGFDGCSAKMISRGTTIISARGTVGKLAMAAGDMVFNQSCYGMEGTRKHTDEFVYFSAVRAVNILQSMSHGSVFSTITRKTFDGLEVVYAPDPVVEAFAAQAGAMLERILGAQREIQTLAALRDTLLPRLMSGKLRIRGAEKQVEEAV
ncbi:restriction endonuclease subunit S [Maritimibacter sp. DP07]|uniref:Restriction endonuclease subunit S n=1 Tax=Maritimibacter harenae TaxID=2606218 RepID=A0A845M5M6_9RHOB|nr:restriction endonuclease subunit S [Maritimibacter harenae]MZR14329.1 restriction endonuclease subunit S [Maritimibacter harenae]